MRANTKIILLVAIVFALASIPITMQFQKSVEAKERHVLLTKTNTELQAAVVRLSDAVRNKIANQAQPRALASLPEGGAEFIPISVETLKNATFSLFENPGPRGKQRVFKLSAVTVNLLNLTATEAKSAQNVFEETLDRVQDIQRAHTQEVSLESLTASEGAGTKMTITNFSKKPGQFTYYKISPLSDRERASLKNWLNESLAKAIGTERAEIMVPRVAHYRDFDLIAGEYYIVAFRDAPASGPTADSTEWICLDITGPGMFTFGGTSQEKVPSKWAYLFKEEQAVDSKPAP